MGGEGESFVLVLLLTRNESRVGARAWMDWIFERFSADATRARVRAARDARRTGKDLAEQIPVLETVRPHDLPDDVQLRHRSRASFLFPLLFSARRGAPSIKCR